MADKDDKWIEAAEGAEEEVEQLYQSFLREPGFRG